MAKFDLSHNPLFSTPEEPEEKPVLSAEDLEIVKQQEYDQTLDQYMRMTFIVRKDLMKKLRDYCYTERIDQKEGINLVLAAFLDDKNDLLEAPEKPKQIHPKKKVK